MCSKIIPIFCILGVQKIKKKTAINLLHLKFIVHVRTYLPYIDREKKLFVQS